MIHIVFQGKDTEALKKSFELEPTMEGDVIHIADDLAVGPLNNLETNEGWEARREWWRQVLKGGDYEGIVDNGEVPDDRKTVESLIRRLLDNPAEELWIWAAQNKHDVSGYYWLISQLKDFQGRVQILYLNNLPFINEKGLIFYPVTLSEIPPREFVKARKLARPVTLSEFEIDPDEWNRHCQENKGVRILEGGKKLSGQPDSFYDEEIKKFISGDWIRANKLIHQFLNKSKQTTGDAYVLWRLKEMVGAGQLDAQGDLRGMKDFEIKSKAAVLA